jgi:hypothetical protein
VGLTIQKQYTFSIPGENIAFLTSATAFTSFAVAAVPSVFLVQWSLYLQLYKEFRIISTTVHIVPLTLSPGSTVCFFDETNSSTGPTSMDAVNQKSNQYVNSQTAAPYISDHGYTFSGYVMKWQPASYADADWLPLNTPNVQLGFKAYTDNAFYNTPLVAVNLFSFRVIFTLAFRGTL